MKAFIDKIRRRLQKSVLQYGVLATIGRCAIWPLMYVGWKVIEWSPFERHRRLAGEQFDLEKIP